MTKWMGYPLLYTSYSGFELPRTGAAHASIVPYGPYETLDGQTVFLAVQNEREWRRFCTVVIEKPDLADDTRFASNVSRVENRDALEQVIADVLALHSYDDVVSCLEGADIAFARLHSVGALSRHPQPRAS
jgi:crotonobetainyl-CoA:carnitine CoA-transferase CaiB-like acyl-CoA transferase